MEASNGSLQNPSDQNALLFISSPSQPKHVEWSFQEDVVFERALALHDPSSPDFFQTIATKIPDKTNEQIKDHFEALVEDIKLIEDDCFPSPHCNITNTAAKKNDRCCKTKKGARWTKEEHEKFLIGLNRYGRGDWRNISRNCVLTKTPTQVASHAQKYFIRLAKSSNSQKYCSTAEEAPMIRVSSAPSLKPI